MERLSLLMVFLMMAVLSVNAVYRYELRTTSGERSSFTVNSAAPTYRDIFDQDRNNLWDVFWSQNYYYHFVMKDSKRCYFISNHNTADITHCYNFDRQFALTGDEDVVRSVISEGDHLLKPKGSDTDIRLIIFTDRDDSEVPVRYYQLRYENGNEAKLHSFSIESRSPTYENTIAAIVNALSWTIFNQDHRFYYRYASDGETRCFLMDNYSQATVSKCYLPQETRNELTVGPNTTTYRSIIASGDDLITTDRSTLKKNMRLIIYVEATNCSDPPIRRFQLRYEGNGTKLRHSFSVSAKKPSWFEVTVVKSLLAWDVFRGCDTIVYKAVTEQAETCVRTDHENQEAIDHWFLLKEGDRREIALSEQSDRSYTNYNIQKLVYSDTHPNVRFILFAEDCPNP